MVLFLSLNLVCNFCFTRFYQIHVLISNIILPTMPRSSELSLPFKFYDQTSVYIYHLSHACYTTLQSRTPWLDLPNNIWWIVLVMQSSPVSQHFLPLRSSHSSHPCSHTPWMYALFSLWGASSFIQTKKKIFSPDGIKKKIVTRCNRCVEVDGGGDYVEK
jgi:hypothetical protein